MLVRLFEVRADDLVQLVGEPDGPRRRGLQPIKWPTGTTCLEVALASEEQDLAATEPSFGPTVARLWARVLPGLIQYDPADTLYVLRLESSWDRPHGLALLGRFALNDRRFAVSGGSRSSPRETVPPLMAAVELEPDELEQALLEWGQTAEMSVEVLAIGSDAAGAIFRTDRMRGSASKSLSQSVRLFMTASRDRRSLFIVSRHSVDEVRLLLEASPVV